MQNLEQILQRPEEANALMLHMECKENQGRLQAETIQKQPLFRIVVLPHLQQLD